MAIRDLIPLNKKPGATNKPVISIAYTDTTDEKILKERDEYMKKNLLEVSIKDEAGQTNDVASLVYIDDGTKGSPPYKATISIALGYSQINQGEQDPTSTLYHVGTFSVNQITKEKSQTNKLLKIECVTISAIDKMRSSYTRNFYGKTLYDIGATIATESGLGFKIHPDLATTPIYKAQTSQTNQAFLREICETKGAAFKVVDKTVIIYPRGTESSISGSPLGIIEVDLDQYAFTYSYRISQSSSLTGVRAKYRTNNGEEVRTVLAGNTTGAVRTIAVVYPNAEEAQAEALAELGTRNSNTEYFTFTGDGSLPITADRKIKIKSSDPELNNKIFKMTSVNYTYTKGDLSVTYNTEKS